MWKMFTVFMPLVWLALIFSLISTRSIVMNLMRSCISTLMELTYLLYCMTLRTLYPCISAPRLSLTNLLCVSSFSLVYCSCRRRASASNSSFSFCNYSPRCWGVRFCFSCFPYFAYDCCKGFDFSCCLREGFTTVTVILVVSAFSDLDE